MGDSQFPENSSVLIIWASFPVPQEKPVTREELYSQKKREEFIYVYAFNTYMHMYLLYVYFRGEKQ